MTPLCRHLAAACLLSAAFAMPAAAAPEGTLSIPTDYDFKTLVDRVTNAVEVNGMVVVTKASASGGAAKRGVTIPGNMVLGIYRNDFAVRMLEASVPAGIEAPIRFYVTENSDGTASLHYRLPSALFAAYPDGGEALEKLAQELDAIFGAIAAEATAP